MKNLLIILLVVFITQIGVGQELVKMPVINIIIKYGEPDIIYISGVKEEVIYYEWKYGSDTLFEIHNDTVWKQYFNYTDYLPSSINSGATVTDNSIIIGDWLLEKKICYKGKDTILIKPSPNLVDNFYTTIHKPTEIKLAADGTFNITQWCQKCPYIAWNGTYTIEKQKFSGDQKSYINFIEVRDKYLKKKEKSFTDEFNGILEIINNDSIIIKNNNCDWYYIRDSEKESK